jgi:threonine-phosphate decarboxylase
MRPARGEVLELPAAVHGSLDFEELRHLGLRPDDVLDFSANINPYGPSETVRQAVARAPLDRYPDRECLALRAALADSLGVPPERIVPGNGSSELIWLAALAFLRPGDPVLVLGPTFCEYARASRLAGASVVTRLAEEERGFIPDPTEVGRHLQALCSRGPGLVFLANPNNPTGSTLAPEVLQTWAREYPRTLFVVDEAYLPFAAGLGSAIGGGENILVLRSMTKDFGLAGLRLGYAVGAERLIAPLRRAQPPWSVNALAQAAGVAALRDPAHRRDSLERLARAGQELARGLTQKGLPPVPSAVHFFLVRVGDGSTFRRALLRRGVLVRDCASFGLPAFVRIAARAPRDNERLLAAVREVTHAG